jgi:Fe-S oxidoreductase
VAPQRRITPFAEQPFTTWFKQRRATHPDGPKVILWPDTFNNYFNPDVAKAAVDVLEHAGLNVCLPKTHLCCGRPLYEFGMIDKARSYLETLMKSLADDIRDGTPIIGLEPACVSVFREELPNLFPHDEQAKRLREQVFMFSEYLLKNEDGFQIPELDRHATVHGHCHHKSVLKMDAEEAVMEKLGLDFEVLDSGCCGMAGSFGFEKEKYDVSIACGERVLLPAVRAAEKDTLIIADGFSCREQILQTTDREPLHLAQVLQMALRKNA